MVLAADAEGLRRAYERAMSRGLEIAIFTRDLFETSHDAANREAVAAVEPGDLDLVGLDARRAPYRRSGRRSPPTTPVTSHRALVEGGALGRERTGVLVLSRHEHDADRRERIRGGGDPDDPADVGEDRPLAGDGDVAVVAVDRDRH